MLRAHVLLLLNPKWVDLNKYVGPLRDGLRGRNLLSFFRQKLHRDATKRLNGFPRDSFRAFPVSRKQGTQNLLVRRHVGGQVELKLTQVPDHTEGEIWGDDLKKRARTRYGFPARPQSSRWVGVHPAAA
jgi:hypothetical protein